MVNLTGYVQCKSRVFNTNRKQNIFIKLNSVKDCFCFKQYNILVRWPIRNEIFDDKERRLVFLDLCQVGSWINVYNLSEHTLYQDCVSECIFYF